MTPWNCDNLSNLLKGMSADLEDLKSGKLDNTATFAIQSGFVSKATDLLVATSDPSQSVKDIARGVSGREVLHIFYK